MRNQHTLTYNEETWTIQRGLHSSIYHNGSLTKWYLETETDTTPNGAVFPIGFKLRNQDDHLDLSKELITYCRIEDITLQSMVEIIETIKLHKKLNK